MTSLWRIIRVAAITYGALTALAGCATVEGIGSSVGRKTEAFLDGLKAAPKDSSESRQPADKGNSRDGWEAPDLDLGRAADYLSDIERQIVLELNKARTDPKRYAELYVNPRLGNFTGKDYSEPGSITIRTNEGRPAVEECIRSLQSSAPGQPLRPTDALSAAARDHVRDTGPRGVVGHTGSDGSSPALRVRRYDASLRYIGENIAYGSAGARGIVLSLLIDDGVPSRGHRTNIMNTDYDLVGVSVGPHTAYRTMCVLDFAKAPR